MGNSFSTSTTAVLHGNSDQQFIDCMRARTRTRPACSLMRQDRYERMLAVLARRLCSVTVVLENLFDTHNCSAVLRSAEGLGLDRVHVVEQPQRFRKHAQILRGADRWLDVVRHQRIEDCLERLRAEGFQTWAADVGPGCVPLNQIDVERPAAIIMGTEKDGLTDRAKALADHRFTIPMYGFTGSFNVSVSAAVALQQTSARRREAIGAVRDLDEDLAIERLDRWLNREVQRRGAGDRHSAPALLSI